MNPYLPTCLLFLLIAPAMRGKLAQQFKAGSPTPQAQMSLTLKF